MLWQATEFMRRRYRTTLRPGCEAIHSADPIAPRHNNNRARAMPSAFEQGMRPPPPDADLDAGKTLERAKRYRAATIRALLAVLFTTRPYAGRHLWSSGSFKRDA
jgi:hypothetical protein